MNKKEKIIELTHELTSTIPTWDNTMDFNLNQTLDYSECIAPDLFCKHEMKMQAGVGTHMDAPAHVVKGGRTIDQIKLEELICEAVMIDVSFQADSDYIIYPKIIEDFENQYGEIKPNSFVIFYTGWDRYWNDKEKYNNKHQFPSVDISTAELLIKKNISGIGIDTLSTDTGNVGFPVHRAVLGADKYLVENVANAKALPPIGAKIFILPLNIKNATESPIRIFAIL